MSDENHNESSNENAKSDADFESDIHDFRELLRNDDLDGLISALENPELYRMTCDDERYVATVMQGISALAWDEPAMASELLIRFDVQGKRSARDSDAGQAAFALMAALEWRQLRASGWQLSENLDGLKKYLQNYPALHRDQSLREEMHEALVANAEDYASFCEELAQRGQVLPAWVSLLSDNYSLSGDVLSGDKMSETLESTELPALSDSQEVALRDTIVELRASLQSRVQTYLVWALAIVSMVAMPNAMGALLAIGILEGGMLIGEGRSYESIVRPRLVKLAVEHGVGSSHILQQLYNRSKEAGKVGNFDIKIENDSGLEILAALGRSTLSGAA
ncbi:MAG: hypothetical protein JKY56_16980 [Kofleriaceae bacterium]|nr:hypothetical protein [Kofleriaceae bacterium]